MPRAIRMTVKDTKKEVRKSYKARAKGRKDHAGYEHHASEIYFMMCGDYIKIGKSYDARKRVREIQKRGMARLPEDINLGKLKLLTAVPGVYEDENRLHKMFDHLHVIGEWFRADLELVEYAGRVKATKNLFPEEDVE